MKPATPIRQSLHATRLPRTSRKSPTSLTRSFAAIDPPGSDFLRVKPLQHSIIVLKEFCQTAHEITLLKVFKFSTIIYSLRSPNPMTRAHMREKVKNSGFFNIAIHMLLSLYFTMKSACKNGDRGQ
jgi:hypothetical protein